jgi:hypothetical protein
MDFIATYEDGRRFYQKVFFCDECGSEAECRRHALAEMKNVAAEQSLQIEAVRLISITFPDSN